jgi:hypothetical protein
VYFAIIYIYVCVCVCTSVCFGVIFCALLYQRSVHYCVESKCCRLIFNCKVDMKLPTAVYKNAFTDDYIVELFYS